MRISLPHAVLLSFAFLAFPELGLAQRPSMDPVVTIETGALRGVVEDGVASFRGIPFAAPPVGELRWRAPQPAAAWDGLRDAAEYSADCMQLPFPSDAAPLGTEPAEDCLYANVWKQADDARRLPVIVWIYGGGFVNGGSSPPSYSGAALARQGVMVVSFNYRVGRFGTFAHPQLTAANADGGRIGNYGYMDQIAALEWVQRNIAAFGGDPDNVTIVGESAGGSSVHNLLTSPLAAGLFDRAVIMSGGDGAMLAGHDLADAESVGLAFAQSQGIVADDPAALERLRALPAEAIVDGLNLAAMINPPAGERTFVGPFAHGQVAMPIVASYRSGDFARVPIMIGATSADIGGPTGPMIAGARSLAGTFAGQAVPVWHYRFSYVAQSLNAQGADHATDIPYFFDTTAIKYGAATTGRDIGMGQVISRYVTNFAKTGDPNGAGLPRWPTYDSASDMVMNFSATGEAVLQPDPLAALIDGVSGGN
jgi:para-nitrobenzyl esterase